MEDQIHVFQSEELETADDIHIDNNNVGDVKDRHISPPANGVKENGECETEEKEKDEAEEITEVTSDESREKSINDTVIENPKYKAGDILVQSKPFAFIIQASHRSLICEQCWCPLAGGGLAWCEECGLVRYCGEVCKMKGWEEHKLECTMIGQEGAGGRVLNDQLRLVTRIWLKIRSGRNMGEISDNLVRTWDDLVDHAEEMLEEKEELLNCQYNLLGAVIKKQMMPDKKTFVSIYGKMLINSFSLRSDRKSSVECLHNLLFSTKFSQSSRGSFSPEPFGIGIYLLGSVFNHSCIPNCTVGFLGKDLVVTATKDIPDGELAKTAFISYVNIMDNTNTRNDNLKKNWFFSCSCGLCSDLR